MKLGDKVIQFRTTSCSEPPLTPKDEPTMTACASVTRSLLSSPFYDKPREAPFLDNVVLQNIHACSERGNTRTGNFEARDSKTTLVFQPTSKQWSSGAFSQDCDIPALLRHDLAHIILSGTSLRRTTIDTFRFCFCNDASTSPDRERRKAHALWPSGQLRFLCTEG